MPVLSGAAVVFLRESDLTQNDIHLVIILLLVIAAALVLQALGVIIASAIAARTMIRAKTLVGLVEATASPVLDQTRTVMDQTKTILDQTQTILADLAPRLRRVSESAEQISATVRSRVEDLSVTVTELNDTLFEINDRARTQVRRVDGIVRDAMDATEEISQTVQQGIRGPIKQIAAIIAGVQAAIKVLVERSPFRPRG